MKKLALLFVLLSFSRAAAQAQIQDYTLSTEIGAGYSFYLTDMDYNELNKNGYSGMIRFMWNPEHLLSIGLETGYNYLYSVHLDNIETEFGNTEFSASMAAVPVFISFAMKVTDNFKIRAGSGTYLLFNRGDMFGNEIKSSLISIGFQTGFSYQRSLTKDFAIGGELQYSYISKIQDQTLSLQIIIIYDLLRW